jgi:hypothetical protein
MIFSKSRIMFNCLVTGLFVVILQYSTEASSIHRSKEVKNNRMPAIFSSNTFRNTIFQNIIKPSRNTGITNKRTRGRSAATPPLISTPKKVNVIKPSKSTEKGMLPAPTPFTNTQKYTAQPQGIVGTVVSLMGDFMPRILPENNNKAIMSNSRITPIATRIWIFEGKVKPTPMKNWPPEFAPAPISPRLPISEAMQLSNRMGWVMSDQNGQFQVGLPVGEYTILAEYEDDLYLNLFDGNGYFATVEVKPQQTTTVKLENTEKATW